MLIVGVTGTLGSGKGTIAKCLVEQAGFAHFSVRDLLVEELKKRRKEVNRDTMTAMANQLRAIHGSGYIAEKLYLNAVLSGKNSVIESIRSVGEVKLLTERAAFCLIAVDALPEIRYQRISKRQSETDKVSFEQFMANEEREMRSDDPNKQNLFACIEAAHVALDNNGTEEELCKKVIKIVGTMQRVRRLL